MNLNKRYILKDEHPCQFCDIGLGLTGGVCPYRNKTDEQKQALCRAFLYFLLLKQYEAEKFDHSHDLKGETER